MLQRDALVLVAGTGNAVAGHLACEQARDVVDDGARQAPGQPQLVVARLHHHQQAVFGLEIAKGS
ncbi:hypothetical protein D3C85_1904020 [compost metagenome]